MKLALMRIFALVLLAVSAASPAVVLAQNPLNPACQGAAAQSEVCGPIDPDNPISGSESVIMRVANIISFVAGFAAIVVIIIGGLRMILSSGDAGKVKSGRDSVIYAAIGLIVILLARSIVVLVVNAGS